MLPDVEDYAKLTREFSMLRFARMLPTLSQWPNCFSTRFSQMTFFLFGIFFTHLNLFILLVVWFMRISPKWYKVLNTVAHTSFAWAGLDVALISMYVTLMEVRDLNPVPCNGDCARFLSLFLKPGEHLQNWGDHGVEVHITFDCGNALGPAYIYLVVGCLLHHVIGRRVMNLLEHGVGAQLEIEAHPSVFASDSSLADVAESIRNEISIEIELTNSSGGSDDELPKSSVTSPTNNTETWKTGNDDESNGSTAPYQFRRHDDETTAASKHNTTR
jgi:hypothetical protein